MCCRGIYFYLVLLRGGLQVYHFYYINLYSRVYKPLPSCIMKPFAPEGGKFHLAEGLFSDYGNGIRCPTCPVTPRVHRGFIRDQAGKCTKSGYPRRQWNCQRSANTKAGTKVLNRCQRVTCTKFIELAREQLHRDRFANVIERVCRNPALDDELRSAIRALGLRGPPSTEDFVLDSQSSLLDDIVDPPALPEKKPFLSLSSSATTSSSAGPTGVISSPSEGKHIRRKVSAPLSHTAVQAVTALPRTTQARLPATYSGLSQGGPKLVSQKSVTVPQPRLTTLQPLPATRLSSPPLQSSQPQPTPTVEGSQVTPSATKPRPLLGEKTEELNTKKRKTPPLDFITPPTRLRRHSLPLDGSDRLREERRVDFYELGRVSKAWDVFRVSIGLTEPFRYFNEKGRAALAELREVALSRTGVTPQIPAPKPQPLVSTAVPPPTQKGPSTQRTFTQATPEQKRQRFRRKPKWKFPQTGAK